MQTAVWRHTLGDLLRRSAARAPHSIAVRCGNVLWTYAELDALCNRLAAGLAACGITKGDRVAILSRNSHAFAATRFALARLGAVLVPINFMLRPEEAAYILRHSAAKLLCVDSELAELGRQATRLDTAVEQLMWLPGEEPSEPLRGCLSFEELCATRSRPPGAEPDIDLDSRDVAQIIYTSGTESLPKGAMLTHEAVIAEYVTCLVDAEIAEDDLMLHAMPMFHCAQLDVFFGPAIYVGASNVITAKPSQIEY